MPNPSEGLFSDAHAQVKRRRRTTHAPRDILYDELEPLWLFFKWIGLFPLQKPLPGVTKFKWSSKEVAYAITFYVLMNIVVGFEVRQRAIIAFSTEHDFVYNMFCYLLLLYLLPHLCLPVCHLMNAQKLANLMVNWAAFQMRFHRVTKNQLELSLRSPTRTVTLCLVVACTLLVTGEFFAVRGLAKPWEIFYYSYATSLMNVHLLLWYLMCTVSSRTSQRMMQFFKQDFVSSGGMDHQSVSDYRLLWLDLSQLTRQFGHVFCYQFGAVTLLWFTINTLSLYELLSPAGMTEGPTVFHAGMIANTVSMTTPLMIFCMVAHNATTQVGPNVIEQLRMITTEDVATCKEVIAKKCKLHQFEKSIFISPPVVTLGGYVQVNRRLGVTILTTTITYLLVILQFE